MILAPLRGVTVRCFRETFAKEIVEAGFTEAVTPFIAAQPGFDPLSDRELAPSKPPKPSKPSKPPKPSSFLLPPSSFLLTPQFIGKDPVALRTALERVKAAGYTTADLNCGCPFPMIRNKGRGSGLLRTPDVLRAMLEVGCEVMGEGKFSIKARLGVERNDELLKLMPLINVFPLRQLTLHARTARQMYEGACDWAAAEKVMAAAQVPIVRNGDLRSEDRAAFADGIMVGRDFIRALGRRDDARELLWRYIDASRQELSGDAPILGRMKELISYWKELPHWRKRWNLIKICRSIDELLAAI